jgi:hypothetical protein
VNIYLLGFLSVMACQGGIGTNALKKPFGGFKKHEGKLEKQA